jgi:hypothetical protein
MMMIRFDLFVDDGISFSFFFFLFVFRRFSVFPFWKTKAQEAAVRADDLRARGDWRRCVQWEQVAKFASHFSRDVIIIACGWELTI